MGILGHPQKPRGSKGDGKGRKKLEQLLVSPFSSRHRLKPWVSEDDSWMSDENVDNYVLSRVS